MQYGFYGVCAGGELKMAIGESLYVNGNFSQIKSCNISLFLPRARPGVKRIVCLFCLLGFNVRAAI